jgi:hypothetical protein
MALSIATLSARGVLADTGASAACDGPSIRATDASMPGLTAAAEALRKRLVRVQDVDRCADVLLVPDAGGVLVVVRLSDGRSALRHSATAAGAVASAEALLTLLPSTHPLDATALLVVAPEAPSASTDAAVPAPSAGDAARSTHVRTVEVDVGIGIGTRMSARPGYVGYGFVAHVDVAINQWFLGTWVRWDVDERPLGVTLPRGFTASSFLLGAFTGRRFFVRRCALDVLVGPGIVAENEESAGPLTDDVGGIVASYSVGSSLRVSLPAGGNPAAFVLVGAEVYPSQLQHPARADASLPPLPGWGSTLALGATWSPL